VTADLPPRWRIRRTPAGQWLVRQRVTDYDGPFYAPMRTRDTWADAIAYVTRTQTSNYGRAA
jgi:hypothetical protein